MTKRPIYGIGLTIAVYTALAGVAQAGQLFTFDSPGDVVTAANQGPGVWYTDRYAPAAFQSGEDGGGRSGVLLHSIRDADSSDNRPSNLSGAFYNTQGRKYDLAPGSISLSIELFVDGSWESIDQNVTGSEGRFASLWATAFDAADEISKYPIIEFNNSQGDSDPGTFRIWDGAGWVNVAGFEDYDEWYNIGFTLVGNSIQYFVNGDLVYTDTAGGSVSFGNVILQGYNAGNDYDIYWDNLSVEAIPEPSTLLAGGLGILLCVGMARRRRRASAA